MHIDDTMQDDRGLANASNECAGAKISIVVTAVTADQLDLIALHQPSVRATAFDLVMGAHHLMGRHSLVQRMVAREVPGSHP